MTRGIEGIEHNHTPEEMSRTANDNCRQGVATFRRSVFPDGVVARIFKPCRSVKTSGKGRTKDWRLVFERRSALYIEPLMGWTGCDDTLTQVELSFPTLEAAVAYARRQDLAYVVEGGRRTGHADGRSPAAGKLAYTDGTTSQCRLGGLQERDGHDMARAANGEAPDGRRNAGAPALRIVNHPKRSLDDGWSMSGNRAWHDGLLDQAA